MLIRIVSGLVMAVAVVLSLMSKQTEANQSVQLDDVHFGTEKVFNGLAAAVVVILISLYIFLW